MALTLALATGSSFGYGFGSGCWLACSYNVEVCSMTLKSEQSLDLNFAHHRVLKNFPEVIDLCTPVSDTSSRMALFDAISKTTIGLWIPLAST